MAACTPANPRDASVKSCSRWCDISPTTATTANAVNKCEWCICQACRSCTSPAAVTASTGCALVDRLELAPLDGLNDARSGIRSYHATLALYGWREVDLD